MVTELQKLIHMIQIDRTPSMDGSNRLDAREAVAIIRDAIEEYKRVEADRVCAGIVRDASIDAYNEDRAKIAKLREENQRLRELAGAMARAMISYELTVDEPAPYKHRMLIKQARALLPDTYFDPFVKYDAKEESE